MKIRGMIDFSKTVLYLALASAMLFLRFVGNNNEPFGLAALYALSNAGLSPAVGGICYLLTALPNVDGATFLVYLGQAVILALSFYLQRYLQRKYTGSTFLKTGIFAMLALSLGLGGFVAFAPFAAYPVPFSLPFSLTALTQKIIFAALVFLLAAAFSVALKALLRKFLKCRLRNDELLFCILFFILAGIGICRFLSVNAYMGIAFFVLLMFACATKDTSALACAFVLSIPSALLADLSPARFFIYGIAVTLFIKNGRLAAVCALLIVFFTFGYFDGLYTYETSYLIASLRSAVLPSLLFILIPTPFIRSMENKLIFYREKHLSRVAINRNRASIGEKLFEISSVFREIENTFSSLGTNEAENAAKEYIRGCVLETVCKSCPQRRSCLRKNISAELDRLIEVGCLKGKTSLVDMPRALGEVCLFQSEILAAVNQQIGDYRKYMTETENAASGRELLAKQAQGVSEILKNLALEQSEPLKMYADKERALNVALLSVGIVCSELLIYGEEDNLTLSLVTFGRADVKKIAAVASRQLGANMIISEKITLNQDKFCCILRKRPRFDAAFGVASARKNGELASGDTHSVIKIDERHFMVALSDGMGSGEYARKISESTITLLESFYRAKMPSELVLSTINKLLTFSKEETFACVDIAVVDLDSGEADVVKIGSPIGFILSEKNVKVLEGGSLPLGILDSLHPDTAAHMLSENDVLLFLSDGITDAFGSASDLYETLKTISIGNPQQLADTLLERALASYGGVAKDDMTAVAVRLFKPLDAA